ncbi:MAG: insulinase family protein [Bacteroidetes bacterium]|nr:insulinase family protein [Bacteroidota bacterium]
MLQIAYETFTLDNGLKVVIHEDHSIPKAVMNILYRVGSKDEQAHRTGFAHLFEHLMFEGSKHIPHYDTPLQRVGGQNNAFTSSDITNYYLSLPANQLETAFWLESDRMLELAFSQEKLDIQKSVVIEEYKQRYLNQPYGDAHIKLRGLHFQHHPYHWPTIGKDISHIEDATLEEVMDFFFGYYAPNNATMVVAGDINRNEVLDLAEKWFGPIPSRKLKKQPLPKEPEQKEAKTMTIEGDVPYTGIYKMYHIPAHTEEEYYIADILTDLLANGKSSLLFQNMVKKAQVSPQVNAFSWGFHDPGAISIDGKVADGKTIKEFEDSLLETIEQLQSLTNEDLDRIKNKLESTFVMQKLTILNKAMGLAFSDTLGDIELVNKTTDIYRNISLDQVKTAAEKFLAPENSSTLYYLPKSN